MLSLSLEDKNISFFTKVTLLHKEIVSYSSYSRYKVIHSKRVSAAIFRILLVVITTVRNWTREADHGMQVSSAKHQASIKIPGSPACSLVYRESSRPPMPLAILFSKSGGRCLQIWRSQHQLLDLLCIFVATPSSMTTFI